MSNAMRDLIASELGDEEARRQYADELLDAALALQIKTLREQRGLTQTELAERASMGQSQISEMEQIDHSPGTVNTLRKIAAALDLALVIRFESFGQFLEEVSHLDRKSLERASYADDLMLRRTTGDNGSSGNRKVQYITDEAGAKKAVVLSIAEYENLLEDLHDLAAVAERRDEETVSHRDLMAELKSGGLP